MQQWGTLKKWSNKKLQKINAIDFFRAKLKLGGLLDKVLFLPANFQHCRGTFFMPFLRCFLRLISLQTNRFFNLKNEFSH